MRVRICAHCLFWKIVATHKYKPSGSSRSTCAFVVCVCVGRLHRIHPGHPQYHDIQPSIHPSSASIRWLVWLHIPETPLSPYIPPSPRNSFFLSLGHNWKKGERKSSSTSFSSSFSPVCLRLCLDLSGLTICDHQCALVFRPVHTAIFFLISLASFLSFFCSDIFCEVVTPSVCVFSVQSDRQLDLITVFFLFFSLSLSLHSQVILLFPHSITLFHSSSFHVSSSSSSPFLLLLSLIFALFHSWILLISTWSPFVLHLKINLIWAACVFVCVFSITSRRWFHPKAILLLIEV